MAAAGLAGLAAVGAALAQEAAPDAPVTSSLMATEEAAPPAAVADFGPHALRAVSMFAIAPAEARIFHEHDLIQIIVRETSAAKSSHEVDLDKKTDLQMQVTQWPNVQLVDLIQAVLVAGDTEGLPQVDFKTQSKFEGDGEYERRDDFTARLTAEIIEILPNGNLVVESRTRIKMDEEESILKVTGICRPGDVTPANTLLSSQLHDLTVEKINRGELKKTNEKGLITKVLDLIFAF